MVGIGARLKIVILLVWTLFALQLSHVSIAQEKIVKWSELDAQQQSVLKPLAQEWDTLRPWQRAKMLDIANDYPKMDAEKQALVQQRLTNWSRMTPYEREQARKHHQKFETMTPEKKAELRKKWTEYEKMSEAERAKLRLESPSSYSDTAID
jgi:hypothetical protein